MYRITYLFKGRRKIGSLIDSKTAIKIVKLSADVKMPILKIEFKLGNNCFVTLLTSPITLTK